MADVWFDVVAWSLVLAMATFCVFPSRRYVAMRRTQFAERTGAYIDPSFAATFDRDTRRLLGWLAVVLVLSTAASEVLFATQLDSRLTPFLILSPFAATVLAAVALGRLREAGREFRVPASRSAVARPRRVVLSDYVSQPVQAAMWMAVAAVVALAVVVLGSWRQGDTSTSVAFVGACDVVVVAGMAAFTSWLGRALCDRPTPAVDASHLYLQDAWRAATLTWAYCLVGAAAYVAFLGLTGPANIPWLESALPLLIYPAMAVVLLIGLSQRQRFRRRLWRTLTPGQVLLPGQPPPLLGRAPA